MSRLVIATLLAVGILAGSAAVAMGSSALSTDTNAAAVQYGSATNQGSSLGGQPPGEAGGQPPRGGAAPNAGESAPDTDEALPGTNRVLSDESKPETAAAQAPRQVDAQQRSELPFTGFAAIPILLIGLLLLGSGLVLRRRNSAQAIRP